MLGGVPRTQDTMKLNFFFDGLPVGHFVDRDSYPTESGDYRYVPYRGDGHLRWQQECVRSGFAHCSYETSSGRVVFVARPASQYGVVRIG